MNNQLNADTYTNTNTMMRQITCLENCIGNPIADRKILETNIRNNVCYGDKGYIPLSHEVNKSQHRSTHKVNRKSNTFIIANKWDDDLIELWNVIKRQQAQINIMRVEIDILKSKT
jgi:hypothetical protein